MSRIKPLTVAEQQKSVIARMDRYIALGVCAECASVLISHESQVEANKVFDLWASAQTLAD